MSEKHLVVERQHRRRSHTEAEQLVAEFEASGLNRREFSRLHGVAVGTLDGYRKRHQSGQAGLRQTGKARGGQLVPVQLCSAQPAEPLVERASGSTGMEHEWSGGLAVVLACGRRIEVRRGFDAGVLEQLVCVLEGM
jgi:hypothetical protein